VKCGTSAENARVKHEDEAANPNESEDERCGVFEESASRRSYGQATKGARWMPWQKKAMKDVDSCDKPRRAATGFDPGISEWGNPVW